MSSSFVPPSPSQWQGPAQTQPSTGFVPPPPSSWQGPAVGPQIPHGSGTGSLPNVTNEQILNALPAVGATAGALLAPEGFIPAVGAAALGGAIGSAVKQGGQKLTGSSNAPQSLGEAAKTAGIDAAEQGLMEAGGRAVAYPIEKAASYLLSPARMYGRELRPSVALKPSEAAQRVQTGLREGIPVSSEGYDLAGQRAQDVASRMSGIVSSSPQGAQALINPLDIAQRLDALTTSSPYAKQALNAEDLAAIQGAKRQYLAKHGAQFDASGNMISPPSLMTPIETAEEKSATYTANQQRYKASTQGGKPIDAARDAAEKALARGAKEELISLYPELKSLGERDQELFNLEDSLRQFVGRERNKNALGLRATVLGGAALLGGATGSAEAGIGAGALGLALTALDAPEVKSKLAIALNKAAQGPLGTVGKFLKPSKSLSIAGRIGQQIWQANNLEGPQ